MESKSGLDGEVCAITAALQGEAKLHGFRSGGGLRVLRLGGFYGEAPTFEGALALLADDIRAGGRDYAEVYGKLVPHYLTGDCAASSPVDQVLLRGCCVDAWRESAEVVATLGGHEELQVPADVAARAEAGERVEWEARGRRYVSTFGYGGTVTRGPDGDSDAFLWSTLRTGRGATLAQALAAAQAAPAVEVPRGG